MHYACVDTRNIRAINLSILLEKDIGSAIECVISNAMGRDAIRVAHIVRKDIFERKYDFSGSFTNNCEKDAVE